MKRFRSRGDVAVAVLDEDERTVLARVVADVGLLLGAEPFGMEGEGAGHGRGGTATPSDLIEHLTRFEAHLAEPNDPALLRLLPNAAPTDREVADEFRRLTEPDLRSLKTSRLRRMWAELSREVDEWEVPFAEALSTAAALTDVRLVMGTRLGLKTDDDAELLAQELDLGGESDPERAWLGRLYLALTWLQESLLACLVDREDDTHE